LTHPQIPVVNSVRALADHVRTELVHRGIVAAADHVVYGNGDPGQRTTPNQNKLPMIWFWRDKQFGVDVGQTGDPCPIVFDETVDDQTVIASSIGVRKLRARVVMHAIVPEEGMAEPKRRGRPQAKNAEEAIDQLFDRVYASIWRACNGSFQVLGAQNYLPGGSEFAFGAACEMVVELRCHIPDDAYAYDPVTPNTTLEFEGQAVGESS
jgi:hypothetical protein